MYYSDFIMQIFSMLIVLVVGLYFLMFAFYFYKKERRRTGEMNVSRYTFEFCSAESPIVGELLNRMDIIDEESKTMLLILGEFEKIAVGVYSGVLSREVVQLYYGSLMQKFYNDNRFLLFEIRKIKEDAGLYANYERFMEEQDVVKRKLDYGRIE